MKAYTIIELVIVIAIIAIMAAVILPTTINAAQSSEDNIVDIFNGNKQCYIYEDDTLLFVGNIKDFDFSNYTMQDVDYKDGKVIVYVVERKGAKAIVL